MAPDAGSSSYILGVAAEEMPHVANLQYEEDNPAGISILNLDAGS